MSNSVVRSAEIDDLLFRNLRAKPTLSMNSFQRFLNYLYLPIALITYITVLPTSKR
jgi:hypothetical protein